MRVMLCGPMTGITNQDWPFFEEYEKQLKKEGLDPVNPVRLTYALPDSLAENPQPPGVNLHGCVWDWFNSVKSVLDALLYCDAIYLMPGWNSATNSMIFVLASQAFNLKLLFHNEAGELCQKNLQLLSECAEDGVLHSASDLSLPDKIKEMSPEEYREFKNELAAQEAAGMFFEDEDDDDEDEEEDESDNEERVDYERPLTVIEDDISTVEELADGNVLDQQNQQKNNLSDIGEWMQRMLGVDAPSKRGRKQC